MKAAYKQFAIASYDRCRQVIAVKSPDGPVMGFVGNMLLFGGGAAVVAFNRVSRLLWRVWSVAFCYLPTSMIFHFLKVPL